MGSKNNSQILFAPSLSFLIFSPIFTENLEKMEFPESLLYTKDHEWIRIEGNNATVGITAHAVHELGDIVYVDIDSVGKTLEASAIFGAVETSKATSELYLPVAGTVTEKNAALDSNPELVNDDPYGKGWMVKMTMANVDETDGLLDSAAYQAYINE